MKPKSGLGRGFDSLIPADLDTGSLLDEGERVQNLPIDTIKPSKDQPRTNFDNQALEELSSSIKQHGIVQPLVVTPSEQKNYSIVAGERRWRAAKLAGFRTVPAIVRNHETLERLEIALVENVQRVDLSPIEQAVSIERLHQQFNISYKDIAKKLGKAATTVNNIVRLLQLPDKAKQALMNSDVSEGHARAILALKDFPDQQDELLANIKSKKWSVRQAEQFVVSHKKSSGSKPAIERRMSATNPNTEILSQKLKTDVTIRRTAKGGKLEIAFKNDDHLEKITSKLIGN